jgi:glycyl-tRNA synthetase
MFKTSIGAHGDITGYGRPEAAQGIFVDFKRVYESSREKLPIGVAQVGTVMRNEISPRQGPLRLREFTIMEMELFFDPNEAANGVLDCVNDVELPLLTAEQRERGSSTLTRVKVAQARAQGLVQNEWLGYFMALSAIFVKMLGVPYERQRFEEKLSSERAHYSSQTFDHQILLDRWGWVEIAGHAYRTDFDLTAHIKGSGVDLSIFKPHAAPLDRKATVIVPVDSVLGPLLREKSVKVLGAIARSKPEDVQAAFGKQGFFEVEGFNLLPSHVRFEERNIRESGRRVVPHVVEPSYGAERLVYSVLEYAYSRTEGRVVLRLPRFLAPVQVMVLPLMPKDGLPRIAMQIADHLIQNDFDVDYDESGTIGRRYARADEIGVPVSVTVDYQTERDGTVTLRDRESWLQVRTERSSVSEPLRRFFQGTLGFGELGTPIQAGSDS